MVTRPSFPVWPYRIAMIVIVLIIIAPIVSVVIASNLAESHGCRLDEGSPHPCIIGGSDWGETLYAMGVMGWLMLVTPVIGIVLIAIWVIVRELHRRAWVNRHGPG